MECSRSNENTRLRGSQRSGGSDPNKKIYKQISAEGNEYISANIQKMLEMNFEKCLAESGLNVSSMTSSISG